MGTILQERVPQQWPERLSVRERERRKRASWSSSGPREASYKMGRRQSQRKSLQPQSMFPSQENNNEKRPQQRRKQKHAPPSSKHTAPQHRSSELTSHPMSPAEGGMGPKVPPADQPPCSRRDHKPKGSRGGAHTAAFSCRRLSDSSPDLLGRLWLRPEGGGVRGGGGGDSDTDLSDSERLPEPPPGWAPPQLELRPEIIEAEGCSSPSRTARGRSRHAASVFPDFLPPPFNSWSLGQLAAFYNTEGRGAPRPRPVGPLERYLDRLLQLEWRQIETLQEESGRGGASDPVSTCHRSPAATSSRLSTPKCILQCQRAFPLTFLSSLANHSALLSGCACTTCRARYSACSVRCCHSRPSRLSPTPQRRGPEALPKRSYSESRVHSAARAQRPSSPARTSSYLRRMQASGNIRNPAPGANGAPPAQEDAWDHNTGGSRRRRSGSEQRRGGVERWQSVSEKRRSGSECRKGGAEWRRTAGLKEREIKPDAVTAIMDNLPASKSSSANRPHRLKQVEFVT